MDLLKNVSSTVSSLLAAPAQEQMTSASDRVGGVMSTNASSVSQATAKTKYGFFPPKDNDDRFFCQATEVTTSETNKMKFVELAAADWATSHGEGHEVLTISLPNAFYADTTFPAHGPTRPWHSMRSDFDFELQVNAVTGCVGALLMIYVPPGVNHTKTEIKTFRMYPSAEVNIGTDTTAKLHIPYTNFRNYASTDGTELGSIKVFVWCPLVTPASTPGTITCALYGSMSSLQLQCPRPQGPTRNRIEIAAGPGTMNLANARETRLSASVALNGESVANDPTTSGSARAIRSIKELTTVYTVLKASDTLTTPWEVSQTRGTDIYTSSYGVQSLTAFTDFLANGYTYWRGSIVFRVTVYSSVLHKGRLRVAVFPTPKNEAQGAYTYAQSANAFYKVLDIGLNPSVELVIPYSKNAWLTNMADYAGRISIFVSSRLSTSTNCAPRVRFMVEMKFGEDVELCVPIDRGVVYQNNDDDDLTDWGTHESPGDSNVTDSIVDSSTTGAASTAGLSATGQESDKPGSDMPVAVAPRFLNAIIKDIKVTRADHMKCQVIFGRAQYLGQYTSAASVAHKYIMPVPTSGFFAFLKMFAYWNGDLNIHILNTTSAAASIAHSYVEELTTSEALLSTLGEVVVPAGQAYTITVPYYWHNPARPTQGTQSLGSLYTFPNASGIIKVWISFKTISLFQPIATPKIATLRTYLRENWDTENTHPYQHGINMLAYQKKWDEPLLDMCRYNPRRKLAACPNYKAFEAMTEDEATYKEYVKDLTKDGDVEKNPGPLCSLVYLDRGLYRHYGVKWQELVFHMNSENVLEAAVLGKVQIGFSPWHPGWVIEEHMDITQMRLDAIMESVGMETYFTAANNCESYAKEALGIYSITQSRALAIFGMIICAATSAYLIPQGPGERIKTSCKAVKEAAETAWSKVTAFFSEQLLEGIKCTVVKTVARMFVRVICYGICFCSSPGLLTGAAVGTLMAMDVAGIEGVSTVVKDMCAALLEGDLAGCVEAISTIIQKNDSDRSVLVAEATKQIRQLTSAVDDFAGKVVEDAPNDPFRLFNSGTNAARNLDWWINMISRFFGWLKSFFSIDNSQLAIDWLTDHKTRVSQILVNADALISEAREGSSLRNKTFQDSVKLSIKEVTTLKHICLTAQCTDVMHQSGLLLSKLQRIPNPQTTDGEVVRMEPIGIWVSGGAGCGKSAFTYELLLQLKEWMVKRKLEIKDNGVYTTPSGSDHMDGYEGQWLHVIDDMAQNRDEKDVGFICQMISTVPWMPPQAALEDKGVKYSSQVVIATTNRSGFETSVLWDSGAFSRRFPFKFLLRANLAAQNSDGRLDLESATKNGLVSSGAAWELSRDLTNKSFKKCSMDALVNEIGLELERKINMHAILAKKYEPLKGTSSTRPQQIDWDSIINTLKVCNNKCAQPDGESDEEDAFLPNTTKKIDDHFKTEKQEEIKLKEAFAELEANGEETPFESLKSNRTAQQKIRAVPSTITKWFEEKLAKTKAWWEKNKWWFISFGIVGTVVSTIATVYGLYRSTRTWAMEDVVKEAMIRRTVDTVQLDIPDPQRPYNPLAGPGARTKESRRVNLKLVPDGPNPSEYSHMFKCGVNLAVQGKNVYAMAIGPHRVLTYKHYLKRCGGVIDQLTWSGLEYKPQVEDYDVTEVDIEDEHGVVIESDYVYLDFHKLPFQMKSALKYLAEPDWGRDGVAIMCHKSGNYGQACVDIQKAQEYCVGFAEGVRVQSDGVSYRTVSFAGMCGAMIIQKIEGAWKIVAMHHAGNRETHGFGFRIRTLPEPQGIVIKKEPAPSTHYTPTKTKIRKSPLYGIVETHMQPAPLSARDGRLEVETENLVKMAAEKYRVNIYEVDEKVMDEVSLEVTRNLFAATGRCSNWTIEQALSGDGMNPIDMQTSPGKKYVDRGLKKKDLFWKDAAGNWEVHPMFRDDVNKMLDDIDRGKAHTVFAATLKDELRPNEKVAQGKTRCIEACPVDFTVAFRMIFGRLYNQIYKSDAMQTGLAVGADPHLDFHGIITNMLPTWFAVDFSRFDGSLSEQLMRVAGEVMCAPLDDPELGMKALMPVLTSTHWVHDELWTVHGGMPSGSPCTTVLNSLCNLLVIKYSLLKSGITDLSEARVVTYGDDVLGSFTGEFDSAQFVQVIKDSFGMDATSANKATTEVLIDPKEATFLKRYFRFFPDTKFYTGVLDLESMLQKIQYCHGIAQFKQQFESFLIELVLHGPDTYTSVIELARHALDKHGIYSPPYDVMWKRAYNLLFE
uniref:Genome polyprotein n=1 Tax=Wenling lepidotrigla picornavirus TaxID=2116209 RepID=A0A2P1GNK4_9VIRU|nr:polyprotein [Wenling lepidotrigla picornavirus]